jgi:hypothetical protein
MTAQFEPAAPSRPRRHVAVNALAAIGGLTVIALLGLLVVRTLAPAPVAPPVASAQPASSPERDALMQWASYGGTPAMNAVYAAASGSATCPAIDSAVNTAGALPDIPDQQANIHWRGALFQLSLVNVACTEGTVNPGAQAEFTTEWNALQARLGQITG